MKTHEIEAKIDKLPNYIILEINDFVDFLLAKYGNKKLIKVNLNLIGKADCQN